MVIVPNCWVNMLLQVKSGASLSCLFFTCLIRRKDRAVETCRTIVMLLLFSHEFESHGRHSYKVFPHLNFGVIFFHVFFYYFLCMFPFFVLMLFVCVFFFIVFLGCVVCCCCFFVNMFLIFILNFNRNRQNNITMKFQDASCPPLSVSVLSSPVEPPSQSLAV